MPGKLTQSQGLAGTRPIRCWRIQIHDLLSPKFCLLQKLCKILPHVSKDLKGSETHYQKMAAAILVGKMCEIATDLAWINDM